MPEIFSQGDNSCGDCSIDRRSLWQRYCGPVGFAGIGDVEHARVLAENISIFVKPLRMLITFRDKEHSFQERWILAMKSSTFLDVAMIAPFRLDTPISSVQPKDGVKPSCG